MMNTPLAIPLPRQLDPRKFAQQGIEITGSVALSELTRLSEMLSSCEGHVQVELVFGIGEQRILNVSGHISASVDNVCQRCLGSIPVSVNCELSLAILWKEEHAERLPSNFEPWIIGEGQTDIYQIIEDELLLSLPIVAYHEEDCVPHDYFSSGEKEASKAIAEAAKTNPFQVLQQLKGKQQPSKDSQHTQKSVLEDDK
ncbi:MAG: hypothetical protein ACI9NY_001023 [Kiritimatiellia bacterium]|jgi:uncharacterized protein